MKISSLFNKKTTDIKSNRPDSVDRDFFTPKEFVSGFIPCPADANPIEAAWHASVIALDTERVRLLHKEADEGIYFIAADAADFISHPNGETKLASSLPGFIGHKGDGAYFTDMNNGVFGVVVKKTCVLDCYIGEKRDVLKFAEGLEHFYPTESGPWVGFRQLEARDAKKLANRLIVAALSLAALFFLISIATSVLSSVFAGHKKDSINKIRAMQQATATQFNSQEVNAYADYRDQSSAIVATGGRVVKFNSQNGAITWEAQFPLWVTDLSSLGAVKSKKETFYISVVK
jgi:hypothetical protein